MFANYETRRQQCRLKICQVITNYSLFNDEQSLKKANVECYKEILQILKGVKLPWVKPYYAYLTLQLRTDQYDIQQVTQIIREFNQSNFKFETHELLLMGCALVDYYAAAFVSEVSAEFYGKGIELLCAIADSYKSVKKDDAIVDKLIIFAAANKLANIYGKVEPWATECLNESLKIYYSDIVNRMKEEVEDDVKKLIPDTQKNGGVYEHFTPLRF